MYKNASFGRGFGDGGSMHRRNEWFPTKKREGKTWTAEKEADELPRRIFVCNLRKSLKKQSLQDFFGKFGEVVNCYIPWKSYNGGFSGTAFITFASVEQAQNALTASAEDLVVSGCQLYVHPARPKKTFRNPLKPQNGNAAEKELECSTPALAVGAPQTPIPELNEDCLEAIFVYLDWKQLMVLEQVCQKWQRVALRLWSLKKELRVNEYFNYTSFTLERFRYLANKFNSQAVTAFYMGPVAKAFNVACVSVLGNCCPNIQTFQLANNHFPNKCLTVLAQRCPDLSCVSLRNCHRLTEQGITNFLRHSKNISELEVTDLRLTGKCFQHVTSLLTCLRLTECSGLNSKGASLLAENSPNLKQMELGNMSEVNKPSLLKLLTTMKDLEVLGLHYVNPRNIRCLKELEHMAQLTELDLSCNRNLDNVVLKAIGTGCTLLEKLNISECDGHNCITDEGLSHFKNLVHLRELKMNYIVDSFGSGLLPLAGNGHLVKVFARGCINMESTALSDLLSLSPEMEFMDLSGCFSIGDEFVQKAIEVAHSRDCDKQLHIILGGTKVSEDTADLSDERILLEMYNNCSYNFLMEDVFMMSLGLLDDYYDDDDEFDFHDWEDDDFGDFDEDFDELDFMAWL